MNYGTGVNIIQVFGALPLPHLLTSQHFYRIFFCLKAHDATSGGGTAVQQHAVLINDLCSEYLASAQISTNIYLCLVDTAVLYKTLFPLLLASDL